MYSAASRPPWWPPTPSATAAISPLWARIRPSGVTTPQKSSFRTRGPVREACPTCTTSPPGMAAGWTVGAAPAAGAGEAEGEVGRLGMIFTLESPRRLRSPAKVTEM